MKGIKYQVVIKTVIVVGLFLLVGCGSQQVQRKDADGYYQRGEKALEEGNYLTALDNFRAVKNRFPYSSKAVQAELKIADTYFSQEAYIESQAAYEIFREMHPTHSKIDYVQYRIGLSFFHQIPDNTARDLTAAERAVEELGLLVSKYPKSKYRKPAHEYQMQARKKLAEHEEYVANFYFQRQHYLSSSYRYASLLKSYRGLGHDEKALYRLGVCYYHIRMFASSREALQRLLQEFPNTGYKGKAVALMKRLDASVTP